MATVAKMAGREAPARAGNGFMTVRNFSFDSSYPTGGESLTYAELGFSKAPDWVEVVPKAGFVFEYDIANQKLKAYWVDTTVDGAAMAEVVNATNLSAVTNVVVKAFGRNPA